MYYPRDIMPRIEAALFQGRVIVVYGARQVGKTTLMRESLSRHPEDSLYLNCDEPDVRDALTNRTSTEMRAFIGPRRLVVIDEAQRVLNIGLTLKLLVDTYPGMQVIATGSSSFELSNRVTEPLTGRKVEFTLYPLSVAELAAAEGGLEVRRLLERRLVYGAYPGVTTAADPEETLRELATSYLYRDVLEYQTVRNPDALRRLLQALALQVGSEVSYNELGTLLRLDKATVSRYVALLEKSFVIFHLPPFSRNLRNELGRLRKVYFYDVGIRNALLNNLNPLEIRQDVGALWENYFIAERIKLLSNTGRHANAYFWRTHRGAEVDYLEEEGGRLTAYECKWREASGRVPAAFATSYPGVPVRVATRDNALEYLLS
ncbi:MAG: ATP-binding protein [Anaerolineae bacterium]